MSTSLTYLTPPELDRALALRDLSDPGHGPHAMQILLDAVVEAITTTWDIPARLVRNPPLVAVDHNYDRLGYRGDDITRDARYTRYVSPTTMLRSHTSADIPAALAAYAHSDDQNDHEVDALLVVPGLVYRRDVVDRQHVGEPHQVDLWRLRSMPDSSETDLGELIGAVVDAVLPGTAWRTTPAIHPYTTAGQQVDVSHQGGWLELAECGLIAPRVLSVAGLDPRRWSGLALGMGLDRAVMLRKDIPDIRYLRATEPRVSAQLLDLAPWRPVSPLPPVRRDLSVVIDDDHDDEMIGDTVRTALSDRIDDVESIEVVARTPYDDLPDAARERLGIVPGQTNALVRLTLRPLEQTLTDAEANAIRNTVYRALHLGSHVELA